MTTARHALSLAAILALAVPARAQHPAPGLGSPLAGLIVPHRGHARHESSTDPTGGNVDFRLLAPGNSLTLVDVKGAGVVHRFWMTFLPRASLNGPPAAIVAVHRQAILRMYWDGEASPSVEVPVGDFFGVGFGEQRDYVSLPLSETSGGYNCYWPMPFQHAARWTFTNQSTENMAVWWNVDWTEYDKLPANLPHFHAQWRRENPTSPDRSYTILDAKGTGHYVGAALFMQARVRNASPVVTLGFLEGDEQIRVDGEATPSITGTGTEDYFDGGFYFDKGPVAAPFAGAVIQDLDVGRVSAYRWHVEDAIPFARAITVAIEHGTNNQVDGDYSSVAYFYQREPHAPFPPLPSDPAGLLPYVPPPPGP